MFVYKNKGARGNKLPTHILCLNFLLLFFHLGFGIEAEGKIVSWFIIFNWLASGVVTSICKRKREVLKVIVTQSY